MLNPVLLYVSFGCPPARQLHGVQGNGLEQGDLGTHLGFAAVTLFSHKLSLIFH